MSVGVISYPLVALLSILLTRWFTAWRDQRHKSIELYERYHSEDMIAARNKAWRFLQSEYAGEPIWELYSDKDEHSSERYDAIVQVAYFWYSLYVLGRKRIVDRSLAAELLRDQFIAWSEALQPLYEATTKAQKRQGRKDWKEFEYLERGAMPWLTAGDS